MPGQNLAHLMFAEGAKIDAKVSDLLTKHFLQGVNLIKKGAKNVKKVSYFSPQC